jgi:hypothetical protein
MKREVKKSIKAHIKASPLQLEYFTSIKEKASKNKYAE